jgi:hypothetical protein
MATFLRPGHPINGNIPLAGVGGIASMAEAYAKICAGASLGSSRKLASSSPDALIGEIKSRLAG